MADLRDADSELTWLGSTLRIAALLVAILSGLGLLLITPFALLSPMMCGSGGCTAVQRVAATLLFASPLLLLGAAIAGAVAFNRPSRGLLLLTFASAGIVTAVLLYFVAASLW